MSQPSPDVYEQGRGMDAHNEVMREVRGRNDRSYDPTEPTRVWLDEDNTPDGVYDSLTIILNTGGCRWARAGGCTMCGYVAESVDGGSVDHEKLMTQLETCLDHERENADEPAGLVKIYTSGSFLDEREIPPETREAVAETFADRDRLVVESLPDFVDREKLREFTDRGLATDVAVGLEIAGVHRQAVLFGPGFVALREREGIEHGAERLAAVLDVFVGRPDVGGLVAEHDVVHRECVEGEVFVVPIPFGDVSEGGSVRREVLFVVPRPGILAVVAANGD